MSDRIGSGGVIRYKAGKRLWAIGEERTVHSCEHIIAREKYHFYMTECYTAERY